jgi:hypothetical protein
MIDRRVASGDNAYGRLPIACGTSIVVSNIIVPAINSSPLEDQTAMLTRRCSLNEDSTVREAYNRLRANGIAVAAEGTNTSVQM